MKIAFLAPANSIHTRRWVEALIHRGHEVFLFSQQSHPIDDSLSGIHVEWLPFSGSSGYFMNAVRLRARLDEVQPDLLNVHYASGYGTTAALCGFRPSLLSVWGSDVFDFPYESWWKGVILRRNLRSASQIASTSQVMALQVQKLVPSLPPVFVTPFGVDCKRFRPCSCRDENFITVGTVKTLAYKYGIDLLIEAFAILLRDEELQSNGMASQLRLMLIGGGKERIELEAMTTALGVRDKVVFIGQVAYSEVPRWLNHLDIYVAASRLDSESFGVAAVEASACGLPVVVSDAGGLPEVVKHEITGFVVPRENSKEIASAIKKLVLDAELRQMIGSAGREHVLANYEWEHCVDIMEATYREVVASIL